MKKRMAEHKQAVRRSDDKNGIAVTSTDMTITSTGMKQV